MTMRQRSPPSPPPPTTLNEPRSPHSDIVRGGRAGLQNPFIMSYLFFKLSSLVRRFVSAFRFRREDESHDTKKENHFFLFLPRSDLPILKS